MRWIFTVFFWFFCVAIRQANEKGFIVLFTVAAVVCLTFAVWSYADELEGR